MSNPYPPQEVDRRARALEALARARSRRGLQLSDQYNQHFGASAESDDVGSTVDARLEDTEQAAAIVVDEVSELGVEPDESAEVDPTNDIVQQDIASPGPSADQPTDTDAPSPDEALPVREAPTSSLEQDPVPQVWQQDSTEPNLSPDPQCRPAAVPTPTFSAAAISPWEAITSDVTPLAWVSPVQSSSSQPNPPTAPTQPQPVRDAKGRFLPQDPSNSPAAYGALQRDSKGRFLPPGTPIEDNANDAPRRDEKGRFLPRSAEQPERLTSEELYDRSRGR